MNRVVNQKLKVAIVGCGKFADAHAEVILRQPHAQLVAACDAEPLMAEQLAARYGVPQTFEDLDEMLAKVRPDVVHIATPPQVHRALAIKAMDAGCHVFVEKPLAMNYAEARSLIEHAERTGRKLTTGWRANYDPPALRLRQLVAQGAIGQPVHVESFYGYDLSGPFGSVFRGDKDHWIHQLPGKLFHNNIDHLLNKFTDFMPTHEEPTVVAQSYSYVPHPTVDLDDELRIMLRCGAVTGYATFSANIKPMAHTLVVYGTKQTLTVDYNSRTVTLGAETKLPGAIGRLLSPFAQAQRYWKEGVSSTMRFARSQDHFFAGLDHLIGGLYTSILENTPPPISYQDMLWVNSVMEDVISQIDSRLVRQ
jgi:predicted dehydrogenase